MTSQTPPPHAPGASGHDVAREIAELQRENHELRHRLDRFEKRAERAAASRKRAWGFTWRILVPLLDRKKVVRNFTKLASTTSEFVGPPDQWPSKDRILKDANDFMTSVVRFIIRRRMFFLLFTIIATSIPFLQVYLVVQQNNLIDKTNELFQVQINDMIARAMTAEDEPNTRRMAVALLANADVDLIEGVVKEIFDPEVAERYLRLAPDAETKAKNRIQRLREAGFRAHLIRAVARSVHNRGSSDHPDDLYDDSYRMFQLILEDTATRLPPLLRITSAQVEILKDEILQEADYYVFHVGYALRQYNRLTRAVGNSRRFYRDVTGFVQAIARSDLRSGYFADVFRAAMDEFLIDVGKGGQLGSPPMVLSGDDDPDAIRRAAFDKLKKGVGEDKLDWQQLAQQLRIK